MRATSVRDRCQNPGAVVDRHICGPWYGPRIFAQMGGFIRGLWRKSRRRRPHYDWTFSERSKRVSRHRSAGLAPTGVGATIFSKSGGGGEFFVKPGGGRGFCRGFSGFSSRPSILALFGVTAGRAVPRIRTWKRVPFYYRVCRRQSVGGQQCVVLPSSSINNNHHVTLRLYRRVRSLS